MSGVRIVILLVVALKIAPIVDAYGNKRTLVLISYSLILTILIIVVLDGNVSPMLEDYDTNDVVVFVAILNYQCLFVL